MLKLVQVQPPLIILQGKKSDSFPDGEGREGREGREGTHPAVKLFPVCWWIMVDDNAGCESACV